MSLVSCREGNEANQSAQVLVILVSAAVHVSHGDHALPWEDCF